MPVTRSSTSDTVSHSSVMYLLTYSTQHFHYANHFKSVCSNNINQSKRHRNMDDFFACLDWQANCQRLDVSVKEAYNSITLICNMDSVLRFKRSERRMNLSFYSDANCIIGFRHLPILNYWKALSEEFTGFRSIVKVIPASIEGVTPAKTSVHWLKNVWWTVITHPPATVSNKQRRWSNYKTEIQIYHWKVLYMRTSIYCETVGLAVDVLHSTLDDTVTLGLQCLLAAKTASDLHSKIQYCFMD